MVKKKTFRYQKIYIYMNQNPNFVCVCVCVCCDIFDGGKLIQSLENIENT